MPAVTVDDITTLPRLPRPDAQARSRPVKSVTSAPSGLEGEGFPVRRAFAGVDLRDLDPFVHLDQMGEVEYAPGEAKGTPWHPHRGFETVTYIIDGIFEHHDSNGGGGVITNGDTQWMTAGAGILHIEKPPEHLVMSGGLFHGFQLWVNLPRAQKWVPSRYQDLRAEEVRLVASPDGGALLRIIAGDVAGFTGPGSTYTPMTQVHATISPGAESRCPGEPTTTRCCTCSTATAAWARSDAPSAWASWPSSGPVTCSRWRRRRSRRAAARAWTSSSWAASPSASPSPGWGPSS